MTPAAGRLEVVHPGLMTLVVDGGRRGLLRMGMPHGGPADVEAFDAANLLAGNAPGTAALELTHAGPALRVDAETCRIAVAVAGACELSLDRAGRAEVLATWRTHLLRRGDVVRAGRVIGALRAYLAVSGGLGVAPQLGSRCACLRGGTTGLLARPLRAGDTLPVADRAPAAPEVALGPPPWGDGGRLRVCPGPQADVLSPTALTGPEWHVGPAADRTGLRLDGPRLRLRGPADVASQGCPPGSVQVTGAGEVILLGCDRGTTGGYAIPAVVASVDLPVLGRLRPGSALRLEAVDVDTAVRLRRDRRDLLDTLAASLRPQ